MPIARASRLVSGVAGLVVGLLMIQSGFGQVKPVPQPGVDPKKKEDTPRADEFGFILSETAAKKIESVKKHLKPEMPAEDWKDIINALQGLLDEPQAMLVEVEKIVNGEIRKEKENVKTVVNKIIASFSKQGRDFYQVEVGPIASERLKQALESSDYRLLTEVSERFLHTKAGAEATVLLGKYFLDRGRYQSAAAKFRTFAERNNDDNIPPNVLFLAALSYKRLAQLEALYGGDDTYKKQYEASAEKYWQRLVKEVGDREITFGTRKVTVAQLEGEYKKPISISRAISMTDWPLARGNTSNNGQGIGSRPFLEPTWQFSMMPILDEQDKKEKGPSFNWIEQQLKQVFGHLESRPNIPPLPAFFPIASSGKIIIRTYEGIYAIATKEDVTLGVKPGEILWMTECDNSLYSMLKDGGKKALLQQWWSPWYFPQNGPAGIFFENGLLGSISHDGNNVYFVDDLAVPPHPQFMQNQFGFGGMPMTFGPFQDAVYANQLKAVNLETGKLVWKAGSRSKSKKVNPEEPDKETSQSVLSDAIFLGPPMPFRELLYVMIEKDRELRLVCLDPRKVDPVTRHPELVWQQPLGSPNVPLPNDTMRRIQGLHMAYGDGVLVCPTNAGAVLGVDLLSHSIIWAKSYRAAQPVDLNMGGNPGIVRPRPFPQPNSNVNLNQDRWRTSAPIIANGKVVFTAYDSNSVMCLSLREGDTLWEVARSSDDLYIAGVFDNKVMVVGRTQVRFLDLNNKGSQIGNIIPIGVPAGMGAASKDIYFLPIKASPDTKEPEIWSIDVTQGKVVAKTRSRKKHQAGNLLFFEGAMYSQNAYNLTCFPQLDIKIQEMKARLDKNANDPIGLAEMGDLLLDDGKLDEAIKTLKRSLENKPDDATKAKAREKLYDAITELLQRDFNSGEPYLVEYNALCEVAIPADADPFKRQQLAEEELRRKSNYFCLVAKGKESQGKLVEAFENYMAFGALAGNRELVPSIDQPGTLTRPDVWARGRINSMLDKATPAQREPLERKAFEQWEQIKKKGDLESIRGFVRVFGSRFSAGSEARLMLADKLIATNNEEELREAENLLLSLKLSEEVSVAAKAIDALARLYIRKNLLDDAVALYNQLGQNFTKIPVRDGKTGGDLFNELITDKRFLPYLEPLRQSWSNVEFRAEIIQNAYNAQPVQQSFTIEPDSERIPFFDRNRVVMDMNHQTTGMWCLKVFDRVTNEEKFRSAPMQPPTYIHQYPQTNNHRFAQIRGHLLLLNLGNMVYAFDLADRKKLWEYNLFGKMPMPNSVPIRQDHEPDGVRLYYQDGWTQKVGHIGVVESSYICMLTRDGLVAVDPSKGNILWTRSNVSSRAQLIGDENHVFVFESNAEGVVTSARAIRAADGVEITVKDSSTVFNNLKRSKTFGRRVLVLDEKDGKRSLRLYDVLTGKDDWTRELQGNVQMLRSEDRNLSGFVSDKGDVVIFNIKDGKEVFQGKLDAKMVTKHLEKVNETVLITDRDRYYVMLNRPEEANRINQNPSVTPGMRTLKVNGVMYAFDRLTGKRLWFTDDELISQQIILEQFQDIPVMIACHQAPLINNGVFIGQTMKLMALDKATGKTLIKPRDVPPNGPFFALTADPKTSTIELVRADYRAKFIPVSEKPAGSIGVNPPVGSNPPPLPPRRGPIVIQPVAPPQLER